MWAHVGKAKRVGMRVDTKTSSRVIVKLALGTPALAQGDATPPAPIATLARRIPGEAQ